LQGPISKVIKKKGKAGSKVGVSSTDEPGGERKETGPPPKLYKAETEQLF